MSQPPADDPGLLASSVTTLRLIVGWAGVALGVLNLAMGLYTAPYVVFHVVLLIAGLVLLGLGRIGRRPGVVALAAGGAVAALGLIVGAIPSLAVECCSRGYAVRHGFPFTILARDPGGWRFDLGRTVADLLFWSCVGLIVLTVAARLTPTPRTEASTEARSAPPRTTTAHAEGRSAGDQPSEARAADDENVGGLP